MFLEALAQGHVPKDAAMQVKAIESVTNHDVKAVEYWLRDQLIKLGATPAILSHIHFAFTSEDINNIAYALMLRDMREKIIFPTFDLVIKNISTLARALAETPMLSRTHGQTASPTTMGKELSVFAWRLYRQRKAIGDQHILAKFNGGL